MKHLIALRRHRTAALIAVLLACGEPRSSDQPADTLPAPAVEPADTLVAGREDSADVVAGTAASGWTAGIIEKRSAVTGVATLAAVRVARNDGYERMVLEFAGDELPSYHVEYVDKPVRQCGSGDVVTIAGDAWLRIRLEPARAHTDEGRATIEQRQARPGLPVLIELHLICDFEAQVEWVLGVSSPQRYRVLELSKPARLVIDLQSK